MKRLKIQYNGLQKCPTCKEYGIVLQPYGMKCAFCGYCQYFKRSNTASTGQERDSAHEPGLSNSTHVPAQDA